MIRPMCSGSKNSTGDTVPGGDAHERVHRVLVAVDGAEQLLHLRRRRLERRQLGGELVDRQHLRVARAAGSRTSRRRTSARR